MGSSYRRWADNDGTNFGHGNACSGASMTAVAMRTREAHISQALASALIESPLQAYSFAPNTGKLVRSTSA